jgi:hypothetical protein
LSLIISAPLGQQNEHIQDIYPSWSRDQDTEILNHPVHQTQTFSYFGPSKLSPAVFQNSVKHNNSDTSESIAFSKIRKNSVKIKKFSINEVELHEEQENVETRNSAGFSKKNGRFSKPY